MFGKLAFKSLLDRKGSVFLALLAMTVSIFVLLGIEHIRHQAKDSFSNTVSDIDLVVGSRTGSLNLLLYSVFRIGTPTNNVSWDTYNKVTSLKNVEWSIPFSLGDSHKGYRVLGTTSEYFKYYKYAQKLPLSFSKGKAFEDIFDVVIGSEIAQKLGYQLGDHIVLAHGISAKSFSLHDNLPFKVVGILKPTATPVDQTLHVSLQGIEAIHIDWKNGVKTSATDITADQLDHFDLTPKSITSFMLGLKSKISTFKVQRTINSYKQEPLSAVLPGVALAELWQIMGVLENTLFLVSILVFIASCLGVSALLLASIRERGREIQLLRVIGARPSYVFFLIELEALLITLLSIIFAATLLMLSLNISQDYLVQHFGLNISESIISQHNFEIAALMMLASFLSALIPAVYAYRKSINLSI